jgi:DNA transformation protein and related proteins
MPTNTDFANYCCDLLASAGRCVPKRMFGGFGISTDGMTIAILADLGDGEKLWLKGDDSTRARYEAAGGKIFTYPMKDVPRSMNYFSSPEEAMDSPDAMRPWAALALDCALRARAVKGLVKPKKAAKLVTKTAAKTTPKKPKTKS